MKKRLRKKKHRGEFRETGFDVAIRMRPGLSVEEREDLLDRFLFGAIEGNGLVFGGGGGEEVWEGFVTLGRRGSATSEHRIKVEHWLAGEPLVVAYWLGDLVDAWYGPEPEAASEDVWVHKEG